MTNIVHVENTSSSAMTILLRSTANLSIAPGGIFGLLGPNGSGKTHVINCILQQPSPTKAPSSWRAHDAALALKRRIGVVPQQVAVLTFTVPKHR